MNSILEIESIDTIKELVNNESYELALTTIFKLVHELVWDERLKFKYVHIPELDEVAQNIGKAIFKKNNHSFKKRESNTINLLIASEVYDTGGHTRVLKDIISAASKPTIVLLTDVFGHYASGQLSLGSVFQILGDASVLVLPKMGMVEKIQNLYRMIQSLPIHSIGIFAHHQDVVAYSAFNELIPIPQVYIHHADHNPTLGATIRHYVHIDLTLGNKANCERAGVSNIKYLPLFALKNFRPYKDSAVLTSATSGAFSKFTTVGNLAYVEIIKTILKRTGGKHFHIGPIPSEYLKLISQGLVDSGLDPSNFVYMGPVSSLSQSLVDNLIDVYITSAPVPGGKAYVEALGCGIAIVRFLDSREGMPIYTLNQEHSFSNFDLTWRNLNELDYALSTINLRYQFHKTKEFFLMNHDPDIFATLVQEFF